VRAHHPGAKIDRAAYRGFQVPGVDRVTLVEAPGAGPDLRARAERGIGEETAGGGTDRDRFARTGIAADAFDRAGENPRMAPQQRLLAAGFQHDLLHGLD